MKRVRRANTIDIKEIEKWYIITEDGMVYSKIRNRWLKPRENMYGYVFYSICRGVGVINALGAFAHTLVALKYIGPPPTENHEIDHLDENKKNNHYSNLCWRTHAENIAESYRRGRRGHWLGRNKPSPTLETRILMSNAKKKTVLFRDGEGDILFNSIEEASVGLNTYRKKIYNCIKFGLAFNGGTLSFVDDIAPE
jgi:hypothetical protein